MSETAPAPEPIPAPAAAPADSIPTVADQAQPPPAERPVQNGTVRDVSTAPSQPVSAPSNISPPPPPPPSSSSHPLPAQRAPAPPPPHQPQHIPDHQLKELLQQGIQQSSQPLPPQAPSQASQQAQQQASQQPLQPVPQAPPQPTFQQVPQQIAQQSAHVPQQVPQPAPQQAQPAPQQPLQQQQPQVNAAPPVQFVQSHPSVTTQSPADVSSLPPIPENHAFTQAPSQQPPMPVAFNSVMNMQGPTIAQYYPDMSGRVSSPDGYDVIDSGRLGRTKKDVKRRTKTGCLTCRKRRIKCDERHPVCRNCEKSKRDCLGYDPIFKNQPGQSPIQPAPSQQPSLLVAPQNPSVGAPQPQPPPNHNHHQVAPGAPAYSPPLQPAALTALAPAEQPYDFSAPPAPSTEGATPAPTVASQNTTDHFISTDPMANAMEGADKLQLRQANIEELFSIRGQICQPLEPVTSTPARIEDIKMLFLSYANGIDQLLECKWYEEKALPYLLANNHLLAQYASLLDGFTHPQVEEAPFLAALESRETRIIWDTMTLCRQAQAQNPPSDSDPLTARDKELLLAVKRLSILESLILGTTLLHNPVGSDVYPEADASVRHSALGGQIKAREMQFWEAIGRYLVIQENDPERDKTRDHAVMWTRTLLDSLENRDIIYSILVVRHICKYQPYKLKPLVGSTDEKDTAAKLFVALKFLEDENMGRATNQVVKRITGMILAYWEHAHYNLS